MIQLTREELHYILCLARDEMVDCWGDARYLAGEEGSFDCADYRATASPKKLREYHELAEKLSAECDWLDGLISAIDAEEKAARRAERKRKKPAA